MEHNQLILLL